MDIYNLDQNTGEHLYSSQADRDPLDPSNWLIPAHATAIEPPIVEVNQVAVFENGQWLVKNDYRGQSYWLENGEEHQITAIGETIPANALLTKPIKQPTLDELRVQKAYEIDNAAQAFIDAAIEAYPDFEKLTFDRQEREALAYLADNSTATPSLSAIASARGLTVDELASRVVAKADAFALLAASIAGQRQALHDQLEQAADQAAIEALVIAYAVP